jgi:tetratricopeptide (TPR) repeat protein
MSFFNKKDPKQGAKGPAEGKRVLGGDAAAGTMVRKPARAATAAGGAPGKPGKRFERVARGEITGDLGEAYEEVMALLEEEPDNDELHMRRYEILRRDGDKRALAEALEESTEATGRSFYAVKLAALLEEAEDFASALTWRQRVAEMNPDDPDAIKKLAVAFVRAGDLEGAEPAYLRLLELKKEVENPLGSSFLDDMTGRGLAPDFRAELQAMGLRVLVGALSTRGESLALLEIAARLASRANAFEQSIDFYERLLAAHPANPNVRTWKGELLNVLGRAGLPDKWLELSNELILDFEEHLRVNRGDVRGFITLARLQMQAGLSEDALNSFKLAIRADSREWQAVYEHGKLLIRMGRSEEAINWYEDILSPYASDAPEKKSIRAVLERNLAELYFKLGRYSESLAIYAREEEKNIRFIAPIYEAVAQLDRAEELYKKAVQLTPKAAKTHLAMAEFHVRRGHWDDVERYAREGLKCTDAYEDVLEGLYVALATAQMNRREVERALETMDAAVKESPDSASMLFRKVKLMILAKHGKEGKALAESVRDTLERRLACAPANSAYWSLLGDCYSLLGRPDDAENAYSTAIKYDAQDAPAVRGLGVLAERRQDLPRALELYQRFVVLDPLNLATLPIKQKIQEIEQALGVGATE